MAAYRKKPVTIDAVQWFKMGDHPAVVLKSEPNRYGDEGFPWCPTLEGGHIVTSGDWIITGVKGEHYPCKPDIFSMTYEDATAPVAPPENEWKSAMLDAVADASLDFPIGAPPGEILKAVIAQNVQIALDPEVSEAARDLMARAPWPVAATTDAPVALPFAILDEEMQALRRFQETCEDGQPYDVPKTMMVRLAEIGLIRRITASIYEATTFGLSVCNGDFDGAPAVPVGVAPTEGRMQGLADYLRAEVGTLRAHVDNDTLMTWATEVDTATNTKA